MTTKFERIFRMARLIMRDSGLTAKEAILKAIRWDENNAVKHPTAEQIGEIRESIRRLMEKK